MSNLISFPNPRFQQGSSPELLAVRDDIFEILARLEEIRIAVASASADGSAPGAQLLRHTELSHGVTNELNVGPFSTLLGDGA